jgi:ankyrin repeat protein
MNQEIASSPNELGQLLFDSIFYPSSTKSVQALINQGANVHVKDELGCTPLFRAAEQGNIEAMDALITAGADVNHRDKFGNTILTWIAHYKNNAAVMRLLKVPGIEVNWAEKYGDTPLIVATKGGNPVTVAALLEAGADPHATNWYGCTAMSFAYRKRRPEIVQVLSKAIKKSYS